MRSILVCIFFLLFGWLTQGISQSSAKSDSIEHYAFELIRNQDLEVREKAFDYLNKNLGTFIEEYADFQDSFPRYEGLAVLENKKIKLRIVTYQLYRDTSSYDYGGWVQSDLLGDAVFVNDASILVEEDQDLDFMQMNPENWYGALYYQMLPISDSENEMTVLLFGLDNYHFFTKRKVLETLVIDEGGLHFGQNMIEMEEDLPREYWKKRFILDYSVQAPATLRYDQDRDKIIFDHLTFMPSDISEQKMMRVPDGTYSGFEIDEKEQKLVFIEKVFDQVLEEAPDGRAKPEVKRDLFGNPERK